MLGNNSSQKSLNLQMDGVDLWNLSDEEKSFLSKNKKLIGDITSWKFIQEWIVKLKKIMISSKVSDELKQLFDKSMVISFLLKDERVLKQFVNDNLVIGEVWNIIWDSPYLVKALEEDPQRIINWIIKWNLPEISDEQQIKFKKSIISSQEIQSRVLSYDI